MPESSGCFWTSRWAAVMAASASLLTPFDTAMIWFSLAMPAIVRCASVSPHAGFPPHRGVTLHLRKRFLHPGGLIESLLEKPTTSQGHCRGCDCATSLSAELVTVTFSPAISPGMCAGRSG